MKLSTIKKQFANVRWYKQAGAVVPLTVSYPATACLGLTVRGKRVPMNYTPFCWYLSDDYFDVYFPRDVMTRIAQWYDKQEVTHRGFLLQSKKTWERNVRRFLELTKELERTDLRTLSTSALIDQFEAFSAAHVALWREAIFHDAFDVAGEAILENEIKRTGVTLTSDELALLTAPTSPSTLQQERVALFRLITPPTSPYLKRRLSEHAERYHWIYNDYAVVRRLDSRFFQKELRELRKHPEKMRTEKAALNAVAYVASKKEQLIRVKKIPLSVARIGKMLALIAQWRDRRKAMNQQANAVVDRFAYEFARRSELKLREVRYIWWWEIKDLFRRTEELRRLAHARMRGCLIAGYRAKNYFFYGRDGKTLSRTIERQISRGGSIQGRAAYPGVARGIARIVLSQKDFKKMKRGDILVAPNTRPEYVPIMKIAGAIVSEEGGLTCHTAIVARELKIPAVVGAQGVLAALKDGERIEVDAEKGEIKKLKRGTG